MVEAEAVELETTIQQQPRPPMVDTVVYMEVAEAAD
jgi:hypothetical protein